MKIHEYQGKDILEEYGVPVPKGEVVFTPRKRAARGRTLGGGTVVVKAQIHAGGRGKGGGVKVVKNPDEAHEAAKKMIGMRLVTHQTGPEGRSRQTAARRGRSSDRARAVSRPGARSLDARGPC